MTRRGGHVSRRHRPAANGVGGMAPLPAVVAAPLPAPPASNLERFLAATGPVVPARCFSKKSARGRRGAAGGECEPPPPYFVLGDLWESFREWSAYGAGVPLVLDAGDSVMQYYVPYLSAIQLYSIQPRNHSDDPRTSCEGTSGRENGSSPKYSRSWKDSSSSDDSENGSLNGFLLFEHLEFESPFMREPLSDKISTLAQKFPKLKTLRSCDLLPSSWISVAWYPIYRIPMGPSLRDLEACFLTFHPLATPPIGTSGAYHQKGGLHHTLTTLSLPTFGLASYKLKSTVWTPSGDDMLVASALLHAAATWLQLLHVSHPDYLFFASRGSYGR